MIPILYRFLIAISCGKVEPHMSQHKILGNGSAKGVHLTEAELGVHEPLFSGFAVPFNTFGVILGCSFTQGVHGSKATLRLDKPLFSGFAIPFNSFGKVLGNASANGVHLT
ncbi:hypothetical protein H261_00605 [Paramagnetospirillum caucaseum]|uniref:Uncharacterized protein n=1 Tax=Paramagnetospirillum caucaseum TaxID=1244869 RepID=M3AHK2_9PROT|nr:hypothetical protein H261_00605 [Paramagnetospirillum caucaseum]